MRQIKCKRTSEVVTSYKDYLKTEHWKLTKKSFLVTVKHNCMKCGIKEKLEVHHITYKDLGNEKNNQLSLLCRSCHQNTHDGGYKTLNQVAKDRKVQRKIDIMRIRHGKQWWIKLGYNSPEDYIKILK